MHAKAKTDNTGNTGNMIIHLDKDGIRQARRRLLTDDVFVIFVDALRLYHHEGVTQLAPAELYLSAKSFVEDVLQLPDIMEGIADEMDDILDEADSEDEAMLIMMVAAAVFHAAGRKLKADAAGRKNMADAAGRKNGEENDVFDSAAVIGVIFQRWIDHPLFFPLLDICAKKEQKKWMEGKQTNLLTCELECMKTDGTSAAEARDFLHPFLEQVCVYPATTIEMVLNPLRDLNERFSGVLDKEVNLLKRKLGVTGHGQQASVVPFVVVEKNASRILAKIHDYQIGKSKPKDLAMPVRAAMEAGVIRRPTYGEYEAVEEFARIAKSSFLEYVNPDKTPYTDAAFNEMVSDFAHML